MPEPEPDVEVEPEPEPEVDPEPEPEVEPEPEPDVEVEPEPEPDVDPEPESEVELALGVIATSTSNSLVTTDESTSRVMLAVILKFLVVPPKLESLESIEKVIEPSAAVAKMKSFVKAAPSANVQV